LQPLPGALDTDTPPSPSKQLELAAKILTAQATASITPGQLIGLDLQALGSANTRGQLQSNLPPSVRGLELRIVEAVVLQESRRPGATDNGVHRRCRARRTKGQQQLLAAAIDQGRAGSANLHPRAKLNADPKDIALLLLETPNQGLASLEDQTVLQPGRLLLRPPGPARLPEGEARRNKELYGPAKQQAVGVAHLQAALGLELQASFSKAPLLPTLEALRLEPEPHGARARHHGFLDSKAQTAGAADKVISVPGRRARRIALWRGWHSNRKTRSDQRDPIAAHGDGPLPPISELDEDLAPVETRETNSALGDDGLPTTIS
jgi:hypothetical protein